MRVQTLNEDDYGSCRGVCDLIIMSDTCAQVRTIILNRCKSINDFVLFLCRLHEASVHRFAGVFVYQKYKNNIKELRQNSTTPDKNTVKSNHMRVFHNKYVRSNRRLSDFELHNFHMAFTYERLHTRQWKCVCYRIVIPLFLSTVSFYDLILTLAWHLKRACDPLEWTLFHR